VRAYNELEKQLAMVFSLCARDHIRNIHIAGDIAGDIEGIFRLKRR
jgi:hypothetical protein